MLQEIQPDLPPNRHARRAAASVDNHDPLLRRLHFLDQEINRAIDTRNQIAGKGTDGTDLAKAVYTPPAARSILEYYRLEREYVGLLTEIPHRYPKDLVLTQQATTGIKNNLFTASLSGTSLLDIEQMSLPLNNHNIGRILRSFKLTHFDNLMGNTKKILAQELLIVIPAVELATNNKIVMPDNLRPLKTRLTEFFDYFTVYLTSPVENLEDCLKILNITWYGGRQFMRGLSLFLPARLGITPASTYELFCDYFKPEIIPILGRAAFDMWKKFFQYSVPSNHLPDTFRKMFTNDPLNSWAVTTELLSYFKTAEQPALAAERIIATDQLLGNFADCQQNLRRKILSSPGQILDVPSTTPLFKKIAAFSLYSQTISFLIALKSGTQLLLEINSGNQLHTGLPANLKSEMPHIYESLLYLLLTDVESLTRKVLPELFPQLIKVDTPILELKTVKAGEAEVSTSPDITEPEEIEIKLPKRKLLHRMGLPLFGTVDLPEPIIPSAKTEPKYRVYHTREGVAEELGLPSSHWRVSQVMECLSRFEQGNKSSRGIRKIRSTSQAIRIGIGSTRIALEHQGAGVYTIQAIGKRDQFYSKAGRARMH